MFVTPSNFDTPPYSIPNLDKEVNSFLDYVAVLEEGALLKLLGRQLYKAFIDGLAALPEAYSEETATVINSEYVYGNNIWKALTVTTGVFPVAGSDWELVETNKWLELKNGAEYTYASKVWKWAGMVKLLTPFIYSRYVEENVEQFTGNGVVVASNENSTLVSPAFKVTRAHNKYAELAGVARGVRNNYPYYSYRFDQSFECFSYEDTLYGFLTAKGLTVYPDWCFESPGLRNIAGI